MRRSGEVERLEDDIRDAMPSTLATLAGQAFAVRRFMPVADVAVGSERQALLRDRQRLPRGKNAAGKTSGVNVKKQERNARLRPLATG